MNVVLGVELDEGGDPPRIWSPFGEYPGTAFTRSMGDVIAEELGVSAEPEIIHRKIHPGDRYGRVVTGTWKAQRAIGSPMYRTWNLSF